MTQPHYAMVIEWFDVDQTSLVSIPASPSVHTHIDRYAAVVIQGEDLTDSLITWTPQGGNPLPQPHVLRDAVTAGGLA